MLCDPASYLHPAAWSPLLKPVCGNADEGRKRPVSRASSLRVSSSLLRRRRRGQMPGISNQLSSMGDAEGTRRRTSATLIYLFYGQVTSVI